MWEVYCNLSLFVCGSSVILGYYTADAKLPRDTLLLLVHPLIDLLRGTYQ